MRYENRKEVESMGGRGVDDLVVKEIHKQVAETVVELKKDERDLTHLGDYLVVPYIRTFAHPHEAKQFGDNLRNKILPQIREIVDSYRGHRQVQTVQL